MKLQKLFRRISAAAVAGALTLSLCAPALAEAPDTSLTLSPLLADTADDIPLTAFPDENFQSYLSQWVDSNRDGILSQNERNSVTSIDCSYREITSLEGLAFFPNLTQLYCYNNALTMLDLSGNPHLTKLSCDYNALTSLDLSQNTELQTLSCSNNPLTSLNLSQNAALRILICDETSLPSLDLSAASALTFVECLRNKSMTSLDPGPSTKLTFLDCAENDLESLDVSRNTALEILRCDRNPRLAELTLGSKPALYQLLCYRDQLTSLDIGSAPALTYLDCFHNQLTSLDVSGAPKLETLYCSENQYIASLNVSGCDALTILNCHTNALTELDVSSNSALETLYCGRNQFTALDVSQNPLLTTLYCNNNHLTSLELASNTALAELDAGGNARTVQLNENGAFDLSTLPGFDAGRIRSISGGSISDTLLRFDESSATFTYTYDCGNNYAPTFTLQLHEHQPGEWSSADETYHVRSCTDPACPDPNHGREQEPHDFGPDGTCTVCGYQPSAPESSGSAAGNVGGAIAAAAIGGAAVWGGYEAVTRVMLHSILPKGAAIPKTRGELALLVWNTAGRPDASAASFVYPDLTDDDLQAAARWCTEQGCLTAQDDGTFGPDTHVTKYRVIRTWSKAFPKT